MEIRTSTTERLAVYKLMTACIVPRPIAWVSTQDANGINNLAPFSFFNGVASNPPSLSLSISYHSRRASGKKDTLHNILETGEFVVNIVNEPTAIAMLETSFEHPADVDEFVMAGLTPAPSVVVRPPRVAQSPACFECTLHDTMQVGEGPGSSTLVVGIIQHIYVRDNLINERGSVDTRRLQPLGRLADNSYCYIYETFELTGRTGR